MTDFENLISLNGGTRSNEICVLDLLTSPEQSPGFLLPASGPVADAIAEVLAYNAKKKEEMGILISKNGKQVERVIGTSHNVSLKHTNMKPFRDGTLVHNHPVSTFLSDADIGMATATPLRIWSAAEDGAYSYCDGYSTEKFENPMLAMFACAEASNFIGGFTVAFKEKGFLTCNQHSILFSHLTNLVMRDEGSIKNYQYRMGDDLKQIIQTVKDKIGQVWGPGKERGNLHLVGAD